MKILYIEDEVIKYTNVIELLNKEFEGLNITLRKSLTSGLLEVTNNKFDLVLLDMSLPLQDSDSNNDYEMDFEIFGGIDFLEELKRKKISINVIVITAFDVLGESSNLKNLNQIDNELKKNFMNYIDCVHYNVSTVEWSKKLVELIKKVMDKYENTNC